MAWRGNQINTGMMDRWRHVSNVCLHPLSLSHMQLLLLGPSHPIIILGCWTAVNGPALVMKVLHICREDTWEYMQIGCYIRIWYPWGYTGPCGAKMRQRECASSRRTRPQRESDPCSPGIFNSWAQSLISGGNKARILSNTRLECEKKITWNAHVAQFSREWENTACLAERALFLSNSRVNRKILKQFHSLL